MPAPGGRFSKVRPAGQHRIAVVPYLNTRPLIWGLDEMAEVELVRAVPSELRGKLAGGEVHAALMPAIDLQRLDRPFKVICAGCIASAGPTLTVRVFSQVPAEDVQVLWADTDSHASVALARVLWAAAFARRLRVIPFDARRPTPDAEAEAILMIGDKVVTHPPLGYDYQIDLGAMWYEMTGLPFVFATWAAAPGADCAALCGLLEQARVEGRRRAQQIAREYGPAYGWPEDLAVQYLTRNLQFDLTDAHREGMEEFFDRAAECGILQSVRPLDYY
jgi:chorismate dehydratase